MAAGMRQKGVAMSAEKLRNIAKIPGMSDLVGSLGIELINDIADSYSDMYEALKRAMEIQDLWCPPDVEKGDEYEGEYMALSAMCTLFDEVIAKAEREDQ